MSSLHALSRARILLTLALLIVPLRAQITTRVSIDASGWEGNATSGAYAGAGVFGPALSGDGSIAAFESDASDLVPGDLNSQRDVFVHLRASGTTERASVSSAGLEGNGGSSTPTLSTDGRWVAFESSAANLVAGDTNGVRDIFVRDRQGALTSRVSVSSSGAQGDKSSLTASISAGGRYVAFCSNATNLVAGDTNNRRDVFVRDLQLSTTLRASLSSAGVQGNENSFDPMIAGDGTAVVFTSISDNLVVGDTNTHRDIFVRDIAAGITTRVNVDSAGIQSNFETDHGVISGYGRYVAFQSGGDNLVPGDTNGVRDIFVHDRQTAVTERVNLSSSGAQANFFTFFPSISADGRYVVFDSNASNLVPGDSNGQRDVFLRDRLLGTTIRVSVDSAGGQASAASALPAVSAVGALVAFESASSTLVPGDTNAAYDVFVRETALVCPAMAVYCTAKVNSLGCTPRIGASGAPLVAGYDAFRITAVNVLSNKSGILFWGSSPASLPFGGGTLCIQPPIKRTPGQSSGGNPSPTDCSGAYSFHFGQAYMSANAVAPGTALVAQFWSRDPGYAAPNNVGLSDGLAFTVCP